MIEAIVLAGGLGTRLKTVVSDVPKPMAQIDGIPFLCFLFDELICFGIERVILAVGYKSEAISNYFGDSYKTLAIAYSHEKTPMGTGGAIALAIKKCTENRVFLFNGDTFVGLRSLTASQIIATSKECAIFGKKLNNSSRYGVLKISENAVVGFSEKLQRSKVVVYLGCGLFPVNLLKQIPSSSPSNFEKDFLEKNVGDLKPDLVYVSDTFIDIGIPEDYSRAQTLLIKRS